MGQMLVRLVCEDAELELAAALERADHPLQGADAAPGAGVKLSAELPHGIDVMIDFATPQSTMERLASCVERNIAMAIGTTGLDPGQTEKLRAASEKIPLLLAPNMSVGVNVVFEIAAEIAKRLGNDYDIEIIEAHHNQKVDAPSGTALRIAESIADALGADLSEHAVYGREARVGKRPRGEIGIHAVRAGDIVGDHTVIFATQGERIELRHQAHSRENFARGALRAAKFLAGRPAGCYSMKDVLGTND